MKKTYQGLKRDRNAAGTPRVRHRATGLTLHGEEGSEQFDREYEAAEKLARGETPPPKLPRIVMRTLAPGEPSPAHTLDWLVERYEESPDFARYKPATQRARHNVLAEICRSTWRGQRRGTFPFKPLDAQVIESLRDEKRDHPEAGNKRVKDLRALFDWARRAPRRYVTENPCDGVRRLRPKNKDGFYTATDEDTAMFEAFHAPGSQARRALALAQAWGTRRGDLHRLGPAMEMAGPTGGRYLLVEPEKGSNSEFRDPSAPLRLDMTAELLAALAVPPPETGCNVVPLRGPTTYVTREDGLPFSKAGFGNRFRAWCDQAAKAWAEAHGVADWRDLGLHRCTVHSWRKELAGLMLSNGADIGALMAQFGWTQIKTAQRYIEKFNRGQAAARASRFTRRTKLGH